MLRALELDRATHHALIARCRQAGIDFLSTPFDMESLEFLVDELGLETIKIASGEITNGPLLMEAGRKARCVILSTGMSTLEEVEQALGVLAFAMIGRESPGPDAFAKASRSTEGRAALRERVAMLEGLPAGALDRVYANLRPLPGGRELVQTMRAHGAATALVSGGFTCFSARVRDALGFDSDVANALEIAGGRLTGRIDGPIVDRAAKRVRLEALRAELGLAEDETMAVGDGANDLDMLAAAGIGVAFRAKPVVTRAARARVDHGDLTALLYIQGYRADDIRA
ncbi:MAG: HAD-IB family phosphatase [Proteobacteria bacterium]|nr:HAD-IB family phosphatase [Pseudomonadota bacterium]